MAMVSKVKDHDGSKEVYISFILVIRCIFQTNMSPFRFYLKFRTFMKSRDLEMANRGYPAVQRRNNASTAASSLQESDKTYLLL